MHPEFTDLAPRARRRVAAREFAAVEPRAQVERQLLVVNAERELVARHEPRADGGGEVLALRRAQAGRQLPELEITRREVEHALAPVCLDQHAHIFGGVSQPRC